MARSRYERVRREATQAQALLRVRHNLLYGSVEQRIVQQLRVLALQPEVRLQLLSTIFEGGTMMSPEDEHYMLEHNTPARRRFWYSIYSWRGVWTWGIGFDRQGIGFYLGPWSGWLIWNGR